VAADRGNISKSHPKTSAEQLLSEITAFTRKLILLPPNPTPLVGCHHGRRLGAEFGGTENFFLQKQFSNDLFLGKNFHFNAENF